jgi:hypothetical protein
MSDFAISVAIMDIVCRRRRQGLMGGRCRGRIIVIWGFVVMLVIMGIVLLRLVLRAEGREMWRGILGGRDWWILLGMMSDGKKVYRECGMIVVTISM